jgi:hypothetical protein
MRYVAIPRSFAASKSKDTSLIPPALLVVVNGFLVVVALSALVSIWFGRRGGD